MATTDQPRTRLEQIVRDSGRSYDKLADDFNDLARRRGIDATISSKHLQRLARRERSHESCRDGTRTALESLFERSFSELFAVPHPDNTDASAETTLEYPRRIGDSISALSALARRELTPNPQESELVVAPEAWSNLLVQAMYGDDYDAPPPTDTAELSPDHIQQVHDATTMFSRFDHRYGGGASKPLVAQYLQTSVLPTLPRVSVDHHLGRDYFQAASGLTLRAGWTAYDTGNHATGQRYLYQAYRLARAASDHVFSGHALSCMSHQANFLGHFQHAVHLARAAIHHGTLGGATPGVMAMFHAMEARALASQGRERDVTRALSTAEGWMAKRSAANEPAWAWFFDTAELHAEFAHCYRDLGKPHLAQLHAAASIAESEADFVRSLSFCRTVLATAHLLGNELDHSTSIASHVIDTAAHLNSYRVISYLDDFRTRLAGFDGKAVRAFDQLYREKIDRNPLERGPVPRSLVIS